MYENVSEASDISLSLNNGEDKPLTEDAEKKWHPVDFGPQSHSLIGDWTIGIESSLDSSEEGLSALVKDIFLLITYPVPPPESS